MIGQSNKVLKTYGSVLKTAAPVVNQISGSGNLGNIPLTPEVTMVSITGASTAILAPGTTGQRKTIVLKDGSGGLTVTHSYTVNSVAKTLSIVFALAGQSAKLI